MESRKEKEEISGNTNKKENEASNINDITKKDITIEPIPSETKEDETSTHKTTLKHPADKLKKEKEAEEVTSKTEKKFGNEVKSKEKEETKEETKVNSEEPDDIRDTKELPPPTSIPPTPKSTPTSESTRETPDPISKTPKSNDEQWVPTGPTFWHSTGESFFMIFLAELGDRTFILIAIFAMKYGRSLIMLPCIVFLILLHCVSVFIGLLFPFLFSPVFVAYLSFIVFMAFGIYMFYEAWNMSDEEDTPQHIESLNKKNNGIEDELEDPLLGEESRVEHQLHISGSIEHMLVDDANNYKIVITVLTAIFLAEWGDRSQLGAIVLTATRNMMGVIIGGGIAIGLCAGLAAYAGQFLTKYVSVRHLTYVGAGLFVFFAFESIFL